MLSLRSWDDGALYSDMSKGQVVVDPQCVDVVEVQLTMAQLAVMSRAAHTQSALASTKTGVYTLNRTKALGYLESGTEPSRLADGTQPCPQFETRARARLKRVTVPVQGNPCSLSLL